MQDRWLTGEVEEVYSTGPKEIARLKEDIVGICQRALLITRYRCGYVAADLGLSLLAEATIEA